MKYGIRLYSFAFLILFLVALPAIAQNASLVGTVKDQQDAAMPNVTVTLTNLESNIAQATKTDASGGYEFSFIRPGRYTLKAEQTGFKTFVQSAFTLAVSDRARVDAVMQIGEASATVTVEATPTGVQTESSTLGSVVENKKIVEIPLNGRFFLDLALLQAGTVVPSTNNRTFLATPSGIGASGINASGTREDSTNYLVDGINISDMVQNQITFQPNIDMIQEFKVMTNAFDAANGRNAGIIVTAVSKGGSNSFHGTAYEFLRNDMFDAKNFFDDPAKPIAPFKRNIFGYSVGGPIIKNKTFFFTSYEGRQGREVATLNAVVPTDAQRATVTNPVVQKLLTIIPRANDTTGARLLGSAPRKRELNQFTGPHRSQFLRQGCILRELHFESGQPHRADPAGQQPARFRRLPSSASLPVGVRRNARLLSYRDERISRGAESRAHRFRSSLHRYTSRVRNHFAVQRVSAIRGRGRRRGWSGVRWNQRVPARPRRHDFPIQRHLKLDQRANTRSSSAASSAASATIISTAVPAAP
jgi:hypothetical protein